MIFFKSSIVEEPPLEDPKLQVSIFGYKIAIDSLLIYHYRSYAKALISICAFILQAKIISFAIVRGSLFVDSI